MLAAPFALAAIPALVILRSGNAGPEHRVVVASTPTPTKTASNPPDSWGKPPPPIALAETNEFGVITAVREVEGGVEVSVDRVTWYGGADAEYAATMRGDDVSNDYYVVNDNPRTRDYFVPENARIYGSIVLTGNGEVTPVSYSTWVSFLRGDSTDPRHDPRLRATTYFHFDVDHSGARIIGVEEQYRP